MKLPSEVKTKLYVWLTHIAAPSLSVSCTTIGGMESQGWTLLTIVYVDINLTHLDIDLDVIIREAIERKKESALEKHEAEMIAIEDSLRLTKEL